MRWPRAVYIHVPFCLRRCGYCDFTLVARRDQLIPAWLDGMRRELQQHRNAVGQRLPISTLFIGGGTPTHLQLQQLQELLLLLREHFEWTADAEISIEANPDGLDDARLDLLTTLGVNRISLGVQSFDDGILKVLERTHTAATAADAIMRAAQRFPAVSLDLIFGVPGQSSESWQSTLQQAAEFPLTHISTYGLTLEQGTSFYRRERRGELLRAPEELEREMYLYGIEFLQRQGFEHYEVSNFARDSFRCRHNLVYWNADEYFAFGPGAASYVHGIRRTNCRSVVRWLKSWADGVACIEESQQLDAHQRACEAMMLALRLREGFHAGSIEARFEINLYELAGTTLSRLLKSGLLEQEGQQIRLTQEGLLLADTVASELLNPEAGK